MSRDYRKVKLDGITLKAALPHHVVEELDCWSCIRHAV